MALAEIQDRYGDWKSFLVKRLTGSVTLPNNFHSSLHAQLSDCPLKVGMFVEVVDKMCLAATRVATIQQMTGTRVKVQYVGAPVSVDALNLALMLIHLYCRLEHPMLFTFVYVV